MELVFNAAIAFAVILLAAFVNEFSIRRPKPQGSRRWYRIHFRTLLVTILAVIILWWANTRPRFIASRGLVEYKELSSDYFDSPNPVRHVEVRGWPYNCYRYDNLASKWLFDYDVPKPETYFYREIALNSVIALLLILSCLFNCEFLIRRYQRTSG